MVVAVASQRPHKARSRSYRSRQLPRFKKWQATEAWLGGRVGQPSHRCSGVELLSDRDERHILLVESHHDLRFRKNALVSMMAA
jgi:hypothetical protein